MKRILFLLLVPISAALFAQEGSVGIGTQTPNEKAVLHLVAPNNDQGFLVPKLTTSQRNDFSSQLTTAENGMMVYDSDLNRFFFWLIDHWEAVGSSLQAGAGVEIVNGVISNTGDTDPSDDFSGDWSDLINVPADFADGIDNADDADNDPANELQDLNLAGDILTISGLSTPTEIDLSSYIGTNTDEQDLQYAGGLITLTGDPDNTVIDLSGFDTDVSDDFSGDWADLLNIPAGFGDAIDDVDDADNDPLNELQDLSLNSNILTITGLSTPTQINLAPFSGTNTDEQDLQFDGNLITLTGDPDNTVINLTNFDQDVTDDFSGSFLDLVDIPFYLDTDVTDDFSGSFLDLTDVPVNLDLDAADDFSGDWNDLVNVPADFLDGLDDVDDEDADPTNEFQDLIFDSETGVLSLSNSSGTADLGYLLDNTDLLADLLASEGQIPKFVGGQWVVDNDLVEDDDADALNEIQDLSFDAGTNILTITNNPDATNIDLSGLIDVDITDLLFGLSPSAGDVLKYNGLVWVAGTDEVADPDANPSNEIQDLRLSGNTLTLTQDPTPTGIDLSPYLDNTDVLAGLDPVEGQIAKYLRGQWEAVNEADASPTNEIQDLELSDGFLVLTGDDTPVSLNEYFDNTDEQDLELVDGSLVLTNDGTPVSLNAYFDNTDLLASLSGSDGDVVKYSLADGGWIAAPEGDNDPNNEIEFPTTGVNFGDVMKFNGSSWTPQPDATGGGSSPWSEDSDGIGPFVEYGGHAKALNFVGLTITLTPAQIGSSALGIDVYKSAKVVMINATDNYVLNSIQGTLNGQEIVIVAAGSGPVILDNSISSNLFLPTNRVTLGPGGTMTLMYVDGSEAAFRGWVPLSGVSTVVAPR